MSVTEDDDDREQLIKSTNRSGQGDSAIQSVTRCQSEEQLDTRVIDPVCKTHYFTVEPIFFLIFASGTISDPIIVNLLLSKVCATTVFDNTTTNVNCSNISRKVEEQLQPIVADIQMFRALLECAFPAFLTFFLGPWSDVNGRKPIILCSTFGIFVSNLMWALLLFVPNLPPIAVLITSLPVALSGGIVTFYLGSFCYISDVTSIESRALRMGLLQVALYAGLLTGNILSAPIFKYAGYRGVFAVSTSLAFLALLYTAFAFRESIIVNENRKRYVFDCELVADMLATCCKKRPYYIRPSIFFCMLIVCVFLIALNGEGATLYLGLRERFKWDLEDYTRLNCFSIGMIGIGTFFGLWFCKLLNIPEMMFAFIVLLIKFPTCIFCAITTNGRYFYLASAINMFGTTIGPLIRSHLSKIVPNQDLGKVFALTASAESLTPLAAAPLYTFVYNSTMKTQPGAVYYMSAGLTSINIVLVFTVLMFHMRNPSSLTILSSNINSVVS